MSSSLGLERNNERSQQASLMEEARIRDKFRDGDKPEGTRAKSGEVPAEAPIILWTKEMGEGVSSQGKWEQ